MTIPPVDIVDETPIGDPAKALEQSAPAGDLPGGADTLKGSDPATAPATPVEKRGRGRPPKRDGGKFAKPERPKGDPTLTARELEKLQKKEAITLLEAAQRRTKALEEQLDELKLRAVVTDAAHGDVIDTSLHEACGFTAEAIANMAAAKWGPAARINTTQKEQLATAWTRVAKIYLGEHAQYSPLAAAFLATVAVVGEKYVDVQLAGGAMPRPSLVSSEG